MQNLASHSDVPEYFGLLRSYSVSAGKQSQLPTLRKSVILSFSGRNSLGMLENDSSNRR
jgi:hypothetical protein